MVHARRVVDVKVLSRAASWTCLLLLIGSLFAFPAGALGGGVDAAQEDEDHPEAEPGPDEEPTWIRVGFVLVMAPFLVGLGAAVVYLVYRALRYEI